jgi:Putative zinc-finger
MNCREAGRRLPGYLDGAIRSREHARLREHLDSCSACRAQLERYQRLTACLAQLEPVAAPADLAARIRVKASHTQPLWGSLVQHWSRALLKFENFLKPLAVPATGGILTALVAFVLVVQNVLVGVPLGGVVADDLPLNLVQPARLESMAPFAIPGMTMAEGRSESGLLLVDATLNAQGQAVSFNILSGPQDAAMRHQLDQVMLFSRFRPQLSFGRPMSGGHVLLSFSEVRVRG